MRQYALHRNLQRAISGQNPTRQPILRPTSRAPLISVSTDQGSALPVPVVSSGAIQRAGRGPSLKRPAVPVPLPRLPLRDGQYLGPRRRHRSTARRTPVAPKAPRRSTARDGTTTNGLHPTLNHGRLSARRRSFSPAKSTATSALTSLRHQR